MPPLQDLGPRDKNRIRVSWNVFRKKSSTLLSSFSLAPQVLTGGSLVYFIRNFASAVVSQLVRGRIRIART